MNADELVDKISDILDKADSPQEAIKALAIVQYTVVAATHSTICKNFEAKP